MFAPGNLIGLIESHLPMLTAVGLVLYVCSGLKQSRCFWITNNLATRWRQQRLVITLQKHYAGPKTEQEAKATKDVSRKINSHKDATQKQTNTMMPTSYI